MSKPKDERESDISRILRLGGLGGRALIGPHLNTWKGKKPQLVIEFEERMKDVAERIKNPNHQSNKKHKDIR